MSLTTLDSASRISALEGKSDPLPPDPPPYDLGDWYLLHSEKVGR